MIIRKAGNDLIIKNGYSLKYYWQVNFFRWVLILLLIAILFCSHSIYPFFSDHWGLGAVLFSIIITPLYILIAYQIIRRLKKEKHKKKVFEIKLNTENIHFKFFQSTKQFGEVKIAKKNCRLTYHAVNLPRAANRHWIDISDSSSNEVYTIMSRHGLWWRDDVDKIYELFAQYKYPRRKI